MDKFTITETRKDRQGRVEVYLDGGSTFSLSSTVAAEASLHKGQTLSPSEINRLKEQDRYHYTLNCALKYMSFRPRSEMEIKNRLNHRGFDKATINQVMVKLKKQGLVDDASFVRFWRENRENFRPRSRRLIELELRQKGVASDTIAELTKDVDDETGAYQAALRKTRSLSGLDYSSFRNRLGAFLKRRGFDYELINRTIENLWQEQGKHCPDNGKERLLK